MIVFIQKESLTSKNSPSLQNSLQPFFIIFATDPWYFWLKAVPPSLEAVLKAIQAFMSSIRSGIPTLKKIGQPPVQPPGLIWPHLARNAVCK